MRQLHGSVKVATREALFDRLAETLLRHALRAVEQRGVFHLALSGGSTPEPFYVQLVTDPDLRHFPWHQTHLWVVDERRVPEDDERSNFRMIREALADHVPMRSRQKHPMPVLADDPAAAYEAELREVFEHAGGDDGRLLEGVPRMDFVLLGMGDDAHTASLFPGSPALAVDDRWIAVNEGEAVTPPPRVTMTFPMLNAARALAVLAMGRKKAATLARVEEQLRTGPDHTNLPITGVQPIDGTLTWYLDPDAAGEPA